MAITTASYTNVVNATANFVLAADTTSTAAVDNLQVTSPTGIKVFTLTYTPVPSSSVTVVTGANVDISSQISTVANKTLTLSVPVLSSQLPVASYTWLASSFYSTIAVANSAIVYAAGQNDNRFGIGGNESVPAGVYNDGTVLYTSGSTYGAQYGIVRSFASGVISFTTVVSATNGQSFTKVQSVPTNSTTPFTGPHKSQNEFLRKRHLGLI